MFGIQSPFSELAIRLGDIQTSVKGVTQFFGSSAGLGVAYGQDIWVAVGNGPNGTTAYSADGITWFPGEDFFVVGASVAYNPTAGIWVAVGYGTFGSIAYSSDGKAWQAATNFFEGGEGYGVAYGNGVWVAVGKGINGTIATSTDGKVWTASATNYFGAGQGRGVAYSPILNQWVAVGGGPSGNICYSSDSGTTWSLSEPFFGTGEGWGITWGDGKWMVVGTNGVGDRSIASSVNSVNWTAVDNFFLGGIGKSIVYSPMQKIWVAVGFGYRGTIGYSTDGGLMWQSANSLFDGGPGGTSVAAGSMGVLIALGGSSAQTVTIGYSTNGTLFTITTGEISSGIAPKYLPLLPLFRDI